MDIRIIFCVILCQIKKPDNFKSKEITRGFKLMYKEKFVSITITMAKCKNIYYPQKSMAFNPTNNTQK